MKKRAVKRRRPKTLRDLVRFFHDEGWEVSIVARPLSIIAKPAKKLGRKSK